MYKQINNCSYIILNWPGLLFIAIYVYNVLNILCLIANRSLFNNKQMKQNLTLGAL